MRFLKYFLFLDLKQKEYLPWGQVIPYNELHPFTLRVRRRHLVEDALRQLSQAEDTDLHKAFMVQ